MVDFKFMRRKIVLKGDFHIHTDCSLTLPISKKPHVFYSPAQAVRQAIKIGLDFLAITDHDSIEGVKKAQIEAKRIFKKTGKKIFVIPGQEITTSLFQLACAEIAGPKHGSPHCSPAYRIAPTQGEASVL